MSDIETRSFSKDYSGLITQSAVAIGLSAVCVISHGFMKNRRRGKGEVNRDSKESWKFGYLYQSRTWARYPSPPIPSEWPLLWVKQAIQLPEDELRKLRGLDATIYVRCLRGCFWFCLVHTLTTFPILFTIHTKFSDATISWKSMVKASISSLVGTTEGRSLLWVHICILFWLTLTWIATLRWSALGAFKLRAKNFTDPSARHFEMGDGQFQHPHSQYGFKDVPSSETGMPRKGLHLRTVMVSNIPEPLRSEKELREYFEYYMTRIKEKPYIGLTSSTRPGFFNRSIAFVYKKIRHRHPRFEKALDPENVVEFSTEDVSMPVIEQVTMFHKMLELASLLERREATLVLLEEAHIELANNVLAAARKAIESEKFVSKDARKRESPAMDSEQSAANLSNEEHMRALIKALRPFAEEALDNENLPIINKWKGTRQPRSSGSIAEFPPVSTIWDALLTLPRHILDPYQPLQRLGFARRVPSIDYHTAKLNLLTALTTESKSKSENQFVPASTAFITFADARDALRARKYLAAHPSNPLACIVTTAPAYHDIHWKMIMEISSRGEFVKDWVVAFGAWIFTLAWIFPVSIAIALLSLENIGKFWPGLKQYLERHQWESQILQSFLPTILTSILGFVGPLLLLSVVEKANTIPTLSALHDITMTRNYKFLVVNVLVFFCIGTAALQSFLSAFRSASGSALTTIIISNFPTAGPFFVGWIIFNTGMHGGLELVMFGMPMYLHFMTSRQTTPRKRAVGIRPPLVKYFSWLPNHMLAVHVMLVFALLNPLVVPFSALYFFIQTGVIKHQLLHVYAKSYETEGRWILVRFIRFSLDGLVLSQVVFLAYMALLKNIANVVLSVCLIIVTFVVKVMMTRTVRTRYESDDASEADIVSEGDDVRANRKGNDGKMQIPIKPEDAHEKGDGYYTLGQQAQQKAPTAALYSMKNPQGVSQDSRDFDFKPSASTEAQTSFPIVSVISRGSSLAIDEVTRPSMQPDLKHEEHKSIPFHSDTSASPMVVTHYLMPWDDQYSYDLPYHNPFYMKGFEEFLWLPRNPGGLLNLDDTIKLKVAISSDEAAGRFSHWLNLEDRFTHDGMIVPSEPSLDPESPFIRKALGPRTSRGSLDEGALLHHEVFESFQNDSGSNDQTDTVTPIPLRRGPTLHEPISPIPHLSDQRKSLTRDTMAVTSKAPRPLSQHITRLSDGEVVMQISSQVNSAVTEPIPQVPSAGFNQKSADVDCKIFSHSNAASAFKGFPQILKEDGETSTSDPLLTRHLSMLELPVQAIIQSPKRSNSTPDIALKSSSLPNTCLFEKVEAVSSALSCK